MDGQRLSGMVPTSSLAASAVTAIVALAAIVATSPAVRDGSSAATWSTGVWLAAAVWVASTALWALAARRPARERPLAPALSGLLSAAGPSAMFVLAMPAVDHPLAFGWFWLWSFALAVEAVVQWLAAGRGAPEPVTWLRDAAVVERPAAGRVAPEPVTWVRDGAVVAGVVAWSLAVGRVDVGGALLLAVGALALAWLVAAAIRAALRHHQRAVAAERSAAEAAERRRRANWIHDELLSELRLARLRLETAEGGTRQALSELADIEHRLRMRQLDVELEAGGARLAEIVQPFVRMAMGVGCRVDGVPTAEVASAWVDARTGYELKRFFGVAVPNALLAGATLLTIEVELDGPRLVARVRDDAGGFDPAGAPVGRGRERLARELGDDRLLTVVDAVGTTFSCEFELQMHSRDA